MPVELRKRPPPKEPAAPAPAAKRGSGSMVKKIADKAKAAVTGSGPKKSQATAAPAATTTEPEPPATTDTTAPIIPETVPAVPETGDAKANGGAKASGNLSVGEKIELSGFGGTVQTHDGTDVTVKDLIEKSGAGIVLFTYPKASTPGCELYFDCLVDQADTCTGTNQACLFRDNYAPITGASLAVYGLSTDSPKANTTFATKQKLPYPLLVNSAFYPSSASTNISPPV